ncbi:MAG: glycoside hydrolase family 3 protein [Anaerolineae bacterium]
MPPVINGRVSAPDEPGTAPPPLTRRRLLLAGLASVLLACGQMRPAATPSPAHQVEGPTARSATTAPSPTTVPNPTAAAPTATAAVAEPTDGTAARVDDILARMSVEEKVGQLFLVHFTGAEVTPFLRQMIESCHVGGIVLFAVAGNVVDITQVATMINETQRMAADAGGTPLLVALDQEGGVVVRISEGATVFPGNMAVGATGSAEMASAMAHVTGSELAALGINMNLAPVLDVNSNPDNPVIGTRSFGSSPEMVSELGAAMIRTYQDNGIIATAKHFPGHGDTAVDSHVGLPLLSHDRAHLDAVELPPFRAAIAAGVDAIMTAHLEVPAIDATEGLPATLSDKVLLGLLRQELGFTGVIVSDSLGMGALTGRYGVSEVAAMAFRAGCDLLAFGADPGQAVETQLEAYSAVLALFTSGDLPESRLDDSVRRILALKARRGVLDWRPSDPATLAARVGTEANQASAHAIAEASVTLVCDAEALLPLSTQSSVLLVAPRGMGDLGGAIRAYHPSLVEVIVGLDPSADEIAAAVGQADAYGAVVVATAEARRHPGQADLVNALVGPGLAVVALRTPYDLASFPAATCFLAAYADVPASLDAVAQVLCGMAQPAGHLPVDIPGLYTLGHGLGSFVERE